MMKQRREIRTSLNCSPKAMLIHRTLILLLTCVFVISCTHIGPSTVKRDRFDYNKAVANSWKDQTLLNIVKLRYADMPLFMEVASIVSGYTVEGTVNLGGTAVEGAANLDSLSLGAAGKYTDRPTITYAPMTGSTFNKSFMTPIPPSTVLFMMQAGWPADTVLPIVLEAINGLSAQNSVGSTQSEGDEGYYRIIELFKALQHSSAARMRVVTDAAGKETTLFVVRRRNVTPEILALEEELAGLLGLSDSVDEYNVVFAEVARDDTELAMLTRSVLSIMVEFAGQVDVPEQHLTEGRALRSLFDVSSGEQNSVRRIISIKNSVEKPEDAFVAVSYKDYWFWIDDRDFQSKRVFSYLMLLFSITETGGREGLPLVTIPAG